MNLKEAFSAQIESVEVIKNAMELAKDAIVDGIPGMLKYCSRGDLWPNWRLEDPDTAIIWWQTYVTDEATFGIRIPISVLESGGQILDDWILEYNANVLIEEAQRLIEEENDRKDRAVARTRIFRGELS